MFPDTEENNDDVSTACNYQAAMTMCRCTNHSEVKVEVLILHAQETAVFALAHLSATALNNQKRSVKATFAQLNIQNYH